jgi:spore coat polysaccharide biosynthesis predicted glycosyltransferase SpsG
MEPPEILFHCNANASVGYGHLRRCLFLGEQLVEWGESVGYSGPIDEKGRDLITSRLPNADYRGTQGVGDTHLTVIDFMYDSHDPEYYDRELIQSVSGSSQQSILLTSSNTVPAELPVDIVVGHLLDDSKVRTYEFKAGFEYAPVDPSVRRWRPQEPPAMSDLNRVFVGFGNWGDPEGVRLMLNALREWSYTGKVDLLLPSALLSYQSELESLGQEAEYDVDVRHQIPSVPELLVEADVAIGTYGHITYEAMGVGTPFLIVGVKPFMVEYGKQLEEGNLAVCAGLVGALEPEELARKLSFLDPDRRQELSRRGWEAVDGCGLKRTAQLIRQRLETFSHS